jgi:hypothetical protein
MIRRKIMNKEMNRRFAREVVSRFYNACKRNKCYAWDVAKEEEHQIQALYLLTSGEVGVRYKEYDKDDWLRFEITDYRIVPFVICNGRIFIDSSKTLAEFKCNLDEAPLFKLYFHGQEEEEDTIVYAAVKVDVRDGHLYKMVTTRKNYSTGSEVKESKIHDWAIAIEKYYSVDHESNRVEVEETPQQNGTFTEVANRTQYKFKQLWKRVNHKIYSLGKKVAV